MKYLRVMMPDSSKWDVPVDAIARNRAAHYAKEFGGDEERSLREDTLPYFAKYPKEVADWAESNMNWSDVQAIAVRAVDPPPMRPRHFEEGWINGKKELVEG